MTLAGVLGLSVFSVLLIQYTGAYTGDKAALLAFKKYADLGHTLESKWRSANHCQWEGVKECQNGRVQKLVLEHLNLNGTFAENTLNLLDQLRLISLKGNALTGPIPDLSGLHNLKSLFLNQNNFSGSFPASIAGLHRLKIIFLADNSIGGEIPVALAKLPRLYAVLLENNRFSGTIPAFNQSSMKVFNVSNNLLSGLIPETLSAFNSSSFARNPGLCGKPVQKPCGVTAPVPAVPFVAISASPQIQAFLPLTKHRKSKKPCRGKTVAIVVGSAVGLASVLLVMLLLWKMRGGEMQAAEDAERSVGVKQNGDSSDKAEQVWSDQYSGKSPPALDAVYDCSGSLVFCAGETQNYCLEDLLRAAAEIMGKGTLGSTYKAVMEGGLTVTVKRLKNSSRVSRSEFEGHMEIVGSLRHPNIVSLRAYFQAMEEKLLVYDYYPNGSLFSLIHGTKSSSGKPLHWTSCLKIAEDVAHGLAYIHRQSQGQSPSKSKLRLIHGNLKSSNVLIGSDFEACITDYGLALLDSEPPSPSPEEDGSASVSPASLALAYRAPECRARASASASASAPRRTGLTTKADVYSFGVLLLEILTGQAPSQDHMETISDLPSWVKSVRQEEKEKEGAVLDESLSGSDGSDDKSAMLVNIAMRCVSPAPEQRPSMRDVVKMIRDASESQYAALSSSHETASSDHSPARWSDNIHTFPRDNGTDRSFTERD